MIIEVQEQNKRQTKIIEAIGRNMKISEIASDLKVSKWIILNDIKKMKYYKDPKLIQAYQIAKNGRNPKTISKATSAENKFQDMTGMTLKEKTFLNMLHYYKPELLKIINSKDENLAIHKLSSSVKRCLKKHDIIKQRWKQSEITTSARKYLMNPKHNIWKEYLVE
jgi:hypothetical protein